MARAKITVVGAGFVGATTAQRLAEEQVGDVVLTDVVEHIAEGKALDLWEAAPVLGYDARVTGVTAPKAGPWPDAALEQVAGSAAIVVTAGLPRKPGMDRSDLLKINATIVGGVVENLTRVCPDAVLVVVSNPLDTMTWLAHRRSGFPVQRVMGMAGVLDTARFRSFIAEALRVSVKDVHAMVLGGHGDTMVPLPQYSTVSGIPLPQLMLQEDIDRLVERTRHGGAEIVNLLKTGSAFYAPSAAVASMVASVLRDERRILPTCAYLDGQYGLEGVWVGVPCVLGAGGIEQVIELSLEEEAAGALKASAAKVRQDIETLEALLAG